MKPEKWTTYIDETTEMFRDTFGDLNKEQLNWKAGPDRWSIAENMHHLIVINETYFPQLEEVETGTHKTPFMGKIPFVASFMGNMLLKGVKPDRKMKTSTMSIWEPSNSNIESGILSAFIDHQEILKEKIKGCEERVGEGVILSSPASEYLVLKLETAFDVITIHERRHFNQAKEVLEQLPE